MEYKHTSLLTSSFVLVVHIVSGVMLWYVYGAGLRLFSQALLLILSGCFLYWSYFFWQRLSMHLTQQKDKVWLRQQFEKEQILKDLKL